MTENVLLSLNEMVDELELLEEEQGKLYINKFKQRKRIQRKKAAKKNKLPKEKKISMIGGILVAKSKTKSFFKTKTRRALRKRLNSFTYEVEDIA